LLRYSCCVLLRSILLRSILLRSVLLRSILLRSILLRSILLRRSELLRSILRRSELLRRRKRVLRSVPRHEGWGRHLHSIPSQGQMPKAEKNWRVAKEHQHEGEKRREEDLRYSCHFLALRLLWIKCFGAIAAAVKATAAE